MRTILLYATGMLLMVSANTYAQNGASMGMGSVYIGPVAGMGNSWVSNLPGTTDYKSSGYAGVGMIHMMTNHWAMGSSLVISAEGYQVDYLNSTQTVTPLYLSMPMRAYYFFGSRGNIVRPEVYLGPTLALKLAEHSSTSNDFRDNFMETNSDNFRTFDLGINGGVGLSIRLARNMWLKTDLGFNTGLTDAVKDAQNSYNPEHVVDLNVGLMFGVR